MTRLKARMSPANADIPLVLDDVAAISTTFTPAASCSNLVFSSPLYYIWYNEPVPLTGYTATDCYPSEWLEGYSSVSSTSSIAPLASPLVCPLGWTTAYTTTGSYIACCPISYGLHQPDNTVQSDRPAYGGTCFSDITSGQIFTVTQVDGKSIVQTKTLTSTIAGQAYAHPIDGIAANARVTDTQASLHYSLAGSAGVLPGVTGPLLGPTSSSSAAGVTSASLSPGAVVGIVIAAIAVVSVALGAFLFIIRHRRRALADSHRQKAAMQERSLDSTGFRPRPWPTANYNKDLPVIDNAQSPQFGNINSDTLLSPAPAYRPFAYNANLRSPPWSPVKQKVYEMGTSTPRRSLRVPWQDPTGMRISLSMQRSVALASQRSRSGSGSGSEHGSNVLETSRPASPAELPASLASRRGRHSHQGGRGGSGDLAAGTDADDASQRNKHFSDEMLAFYDGQLNGNSTARRTKQEKG